MTPLPLSSCRLLAVAVLLVGAGCEVDHSLGVPPTGCTVGTVMTCTCADTMKQSTRTCMVNRTYDACDCPSAPPPPDAGPPPPEAPLTWSTRAPMPTARYDFGAGVLNGKIYVVGGSSGTTLSTVEVYDPGSNTWARKASLPRALRRPTVLTAQGKLYVASGYDCIDGNTCTYFNSLDVYDPATDTWTAGPGLFFGKYGAGDFHAGAGWYYVHGMALGTRLYVLTNATAGMLPTGPAAYAFDSVTGVWEETAAFPFGWDTASFVETTSLGSLGYAVGSDLYGDACNPQTSRAAFATYDKAQDTWRVRESVPTTPQALAATATRVYAVGGAADEPQACVASTAVHAWNPVTARWETSSPHLTARYGFKAVAVGKSVYVLGGYTLSGFSQVPSDVVEVGVEP